MHARHNRRNNNAVESYVVIWGKGGNVASAGRQVTLCDPIGLWHVSSRRGVATLRTAIHLLLTYLLTYLRP